MSLDKAMKNLKFDSRMLEFNLRTGIVTKEEVKKHLEQLPDCGSNCEKLDLEEDHAAKDSNEHH